MTRVRKPRPTRSFLRRLSRSQTFVAVLIDMADPPSSAISYENPPRKMGTYNFFVGPRLVSCQAAAGMRWAQAMCSS